MYLNRSFRPFFSAQRERDREREGEREREEGEELGCGTKRFMKNKTRLISRQSGPKKLDETILKAESHTPTIVCLK